MLVTVNNAEVNVPAECSLAELLVSLGLVQQGGMAIAVNNTVVSKNNWNTCWLHENDAVLLIQAAQGG